MLLYYKIGHFNLDLISLINNFHYYQMKRPNTILIINQYCFIWKFSLISKAIQFFSDIEPYLLFMLIRVVYNIISQKVICPNLKYLYVLY